MRQLRRDEFECLVIVFPVLLIDDSRSHERHLEAGEEVVPFTPSGEELVVEDDENRRRRILFPCRCMRSAMQMFSMRFLTGPNVDLISSIARRQT